ncbi:Transmembrane protein [Ceratobasidium theobromae]|uniref:Transmembrane protein n=1 Tax=Ceratobasidium theobromae TaxID=1582974 RepID=A0A5N5QA51_9AGAM|nr:Transmembrane protein [Ceratobasidium theobromae]
MQLTPGPHSFHGHHNKHDKQPDDSDERSRLLDQGPSIHPAPDYADLPPEFAPYQAEYQVTSSRTFSHDPHLNQDGKPTFHTLKRTSSYVQAKRCTSFSSHNHPSYIPSQMPRHFLKPAVRWAGRVWREKREEWGLPSWLNNRINDVGKPSSNFFPCTLKNMGANPLDRSCTHSYGFTVGSGRAVASGGFPFGLCGWKYCDGSVPGESVDQYRQRTFKGDAASQDAVGRVLVETLDGVSQLLGTAERDWFQTWESTIMSRVQEREPLTVPDGPRTADFLGDIPNPYDRFAALGLQGDHNYSGFARLGI